MAFEEKALRNIHSAENIGWDPLIYSLIEANAGEITLLTHSREHGTAVNCMTILRECGYDSPTITPIITQVGYIKDGTGEKQLFIASHPGTEFKDQVRKRIGDMFGVTRKAAKEFTRPPGDDLPELIGLPKGVSSPFINSSRYVNFKWMAVVFDLTEKADTVAIAAGKNSTLLIPLAIYETIILTLAETHPELKIVTFTGEA